jgi:hypothetical protein
MLVERHRRVGVLLSLALEAFPIPFAARAGNRLSVPAWIASRLRRARTHTSKAAA